MTILDDYIILASNVKSYGESNTRSQFRTRLARRREFPSDEDWRVAVTEITYKQSWYNVKQDCQIRLYTEYGTEVEYERYSIPKMMLNAGYYYNINDLVSRINAHMQELGKYISDRPKISCNHNTQIISIEPGFDNVGIKFIPIFTREIEEILGLVDKHNNTLFERMQMQLHTVVDNDSAIIIAGTQAMFDNYRIYGSRSADISSGFNNIYVYSNIVQQSDVGDAFAPILTTFPNKQAKEGWGYSVHHEPKNLVYRPLQTKFFDTIQIDITDDSGELIDFKLGNVVLKLHFLKHE